MCPLCYLTARALSFFAQKLNPEISGLNYNPHPHHNTASTPVLGVSAVSGVHWGPIGSLIPQVCHVGVYMWVWGGLNYSKLAHAHTRNESTMLLRVVHGKSSKLCSVLLNLLYLSQY